jgi:hypothetical protein
MRVSPWGGVASVRAAGLAVAAALLAACASTPSIRPLGAGRGAVDASVGGPVATVADVGVPIPLALVGYRRGLDDRSDAFGRVNLTAMSFGVLGLEAGASRLVLDERGAIPALSAAAQVLFLAGPGGALAVPAASLTASWSPARCCLVFAGTQHAVSFGERLGGGRGAAFHWSPSVGATIERGRWTFGAELRWWEPQVDTRRLTVGWQGVGGRGALGPMLSVSRRFGGGP